MATKGTGRIANIVLTFTAVALILPCWGEYQQKTFATVVAQHEITIAGTESENPMISEENSHTSAPTTRVVIDRFNEAFNRHDADALATLLTTPSSRIRPPLRTANGSRGRPQWSHSGGCGSRTTPTQDSRPKT